MLVSQEFVRAETRYRAEMWGVPKEITMMWLSTTSREIEALIEQRIRTRVRRAR